MDLFVGSVRVSVQVSKFIPDSGRGGEVRGVCIGPSDVQECKYWFAVNIFEGVV